MKLKYSGDKYMLNKIREFAQNKIIRLIMMFIKTIITLVIIGVVSIIFVQRLSNNELTIGGYRFFTIVSESMLPKYKVGDMIISKKVDVDSIKVGDDLVYYGQEGTFKDKIITHQVTKIDIVDDKRQFHTQGIANTIEDPIVNENQIYGIVTYKSVVLSFLSNIINSTYGFYFLIFLPLVLMIFFEVLSTVKEEKDIYESKK